MSSSDTASDPQQLRKEIEQTRAELGETVQALAAKADVKARARQAVGAATGQARRKVTVAKAQAAQAMSTLADQSRLAADGVTMRVSAVTRQLGDSDPATRRRRLAAAGAAAATVIVVIAVVARRRRS